jgi:hypothetical protein
MEYLNLDIHQLRALYRQKNNELSAALLSGSSWNELQPERNEVISIAIALHKKLRHLGSVSPAEFDYRQGGQESSSAGPAAG